MDGRPEPRRLGLEVRFDAEPIEGRIVDHDDRGVDRRFMGWLGLMSAIEAARVTDRGPTLDREGGRQ